MGVYLPGENWATQGPAPDGFHVPLSSEWVSLKGICTTLGFTLKGGTAKSYLKMPYTGYRLDTSTISSQESKGRYWTSSGIGRNAYYVNISNSSFTPNLGSGRCYGSAIRCFKNVELVPNASWTTLYDGSGVATGAGIFHNSSLGLISLSGDGTTWITIMDKNLGATTVYNDGDTLSEANCGKYYQWGNNYGFPRTGNVTTSSTQVDASNYGPGNYYNSSTFITISSSPYDRSSVQNDNLRGGVDGNVPTMSELKNAYIGEYVAPYLCFTANTAGSTVQLTKTGSPTSVTLETSTDGTTWSTYTIGSTITLSNIGDKVYWRNTSGTDTGFSTSGSNYYRFVMTGSIAGSGNVDSLLNKNMTNTISSYCFYRLFYGCDVLTSPPDLNATTLIQHCYNSMFRGCSSLTTAPSLPATTLANSCYMNLFRECTSLTQLPKLPATTLAENCYYTMFYGCTNIKLSTTQTGEYQTAYRIPTTGTGATATNWNPYMFDGTGGTFTSDPSINTTYYTSNTVV